MYRSDWWLLHATTMSFLPSVSQSFKRELMSRTHRYMVYSTVDKDGVQLSWNSASVHPYSLSRGECAI